MTAFSPSEALDRLRQLSLNDIHSIEQLHHGGAVAADGTAVPVAPPLPIALDEELIGVNTLERKRDLLDTIPAAIHHPQAIVAWWHWQGAARVDIATNERGIGSWITSALGEQCGPQCYKPIF